jgi:hypothetical protein
LTLALVALALLAGCGDENEAAQHPADVDLATARDLGIDLELKQDADFGGPPPQIADALAPSLVERSCIVISPDDDGQPRVVELPPGGAVIVAAANAPATLALRRSATQSFPVELGRVPAGGRGVVAIPADDDDAPWQLAVGSREMMSVCGRG